MVPFRPLVITACLVNLGILGSQVRADNPPEIQAKPKTAAKPTEVEKAPPLPIESRAYKIRVFLSFDPQTRVDGRGRDRVLDAWKNLVHRLVGPAWELQIADADGMASAYRIEDLTPAEIKPFGTDVDKVWLIQGRMSGRELWLTGRELDVATGWLGSIHARPVPYLNDLARELFKLSEQLFAPFAEIGEPKGDVVPIRVQGSGLARGQGEDVVVPIGSIFRPIRVFYKDDGTVLAIDKIAFSYLRVEKNDGASTSCSLIRGVRDPLSKRVSRKNKLIALGIKAAPVPTKLRFVRLPDRAPAAGYVLAYRTVPEGVFRDVATTDRDGQVSLPPGFSSGLVVVRLIAGKAEPMFNLPIMPGESDELVTIPFDPKPHAITLQTQLDALRDSILDLVAVRSRLERRIKAREQGDDWAGVAEALAEFHKLPPRDGFMKQLDTLQENAQNLEAKIKTTVLTKNARAQLADTRSLIERYLSDEIFLAYEDAAARAKERDAKPKPKPVAKPQTTITAQPEQAPAKPIPNPPKPVASSVVVPF